MENISILLPCKKEGTKSCDKNTKQLIINN